MIPVSPPAASAPPRLVTAAVETLLARFASPSPVAGGGAAAALAGALGASLLAMVTGIARKHGAALGEVEAEAEQLRIRFTGLIDEDVERYRAVVEARRSPPDRRAEAVREALARATEAPLACARAAGRLLAHCAGVAEQVRPGTLGDLGVAASLAWAAFESAALTTRINLDALGDVEALGICEAELEQLTGEGAKARRRVMDVIARRT